VELYNIQATLTPEKIENALRLPEGLLTLFKLPDANETKAVVDRAKEFMIKGFEIVANATKLY